MRIYVFVCFLPRQLSCLASGKLASPRCVQWWRPRFTTSSWLLSSGCWSLVSKSTCCWWRCLSRTGRGLSSTTSWATSRPCWSCSAPSWWTPSSTTSLSTGTGQSAYSHNHNLWYIEHFHFRDFCWLNDNVFLVLTFLIPVSLIVGANLYFLFVAVYKIHLHSKDSLIVHKSRSASLKLYVKGLFGLLFLLGLTWSFGIVSVTHPSITFTYIFTALNSFHGFFIFIFNCVLNKKIRNEGIMKIKNMYSCYGKKQGRHLLARKESTMSNTSTTSNTNSTMVKEYFLPEIPHNSPKSRQKNALSITYYYWCKCNV